MKSLMPFLIEQPRREIPRELHSGQFEMPALRIDPPAMWALPAAARFDAQVLRGEAMLLARRVNIAAGAVVVGVAIALAQAIEHQAATVSKLQGEPVPAGLFA